MWITETYEADLFYDHCYRITTLEEFHHFFDGFKYLILMLIILIFGFIGIPDKDVILITLSIFIGALLVQFFISLLQLIPFGNGLKYLKMLFHSERFS